MRATHKGAVLLALAAAGSLAISACAGSPNNSSSGGGGGKGGGSAQLIYGADQFSPNWNPLISAGNLFANANAVIKILPNTFLVNPKFKPVPDTEFDNGTPRIISQNPFVTEYKINPKAKWSDGTPIRADDFNFYWQINNTAASSPYSTAGKLGGKGCQTLAANFDLIKSVKSKDNGLTVDVTYTKPFPDWQGMFNGLLPAHLMKKSTPAATCKAFNAGWSTNKPLPFSGGPWKVGSVNKTQQTFTLVPNEKYWGQKPKLSKLIYKTIGSDSQTVSQDMQNNEVGMVYPQPQIDLIKQLQQNTNATTQVNFGLSFEHIDFNTQNPYLKNQTFRQALALALNRDELVKKTVGQFDPRAKVLNNRMFVNNQPGYQDTAPPQYDKPDPQKALQMLKGIGYTYSGGKLMKNGKQVELNIVTTSDNPLRASTEEVVQNQLTKIGLKLDVIQRDANTFFGSNTTQGAMAAGDCDLCLYAWVNSPYITGNQPIYACVPHNNRALGLPNYSLGCDPKVDKVMAQAVTITNYDQAAALWNQADRLLWNDMFTLPLYQKPTLLSFNNKYTGIADNASSTGPFWDSQTWSVK